MEIGEEGGRATDRRLPILRVTDFQLSNTEKSKANHEGRHLASDMLRHPRRSFRLAWKGNIKQTPRPRHTTPLL